MGCRLPDAYTILNIRIVQIQSVAQKSVELGGKPWHNGFVESFNGKMRDECLNREWFRDLREARTVIKSWRQFYNHRRPHSALGYRTPSQAHLENAKIGVQLTA